MKLNKRFSLISSFLLLTTLILPMQKASALGCGQVKSMFKSVGSDVSFADSKGAQKMVDAYKIALSNPKCFGTKDIKEMKSSTMDMIKMCDDSTQSTMMQSLFGKSTWGTFCKGFKSLTKYTK